MARIIKMTLAMLNGFATIDLSPSIKNEKYSKSPEEITRKALLRTGESLNDSIKRIGVGIAQKKTNCSSR